MIEYASDWISSAEVARHLRVNEARVRALIDRGAIPGRKVANRWLVPRHALEDSTVAARAAGRPFSQENAWGMLFLASGKPAPWLSPVERSRLKARLRSPKFPLASRFRRRSRVHYLRGDDRALRKIASESHFVRSGVGALEDHAVDLAVPGVIDGYLPAGRLAKLSYENALRPVSEDQANLVLREVDRLWPFGSERVAPEAVVAIDLIGSADQRTRRAGSELLKRIQRERRAK